jgi:pyrimidine operon attenuation protein/uracil phosphoribosyltransferase
MQVVVQRLCYQLIESNPDFSSTVLIGLQPRGVRFLDAVMNELKAMQVKDLPQHGVIDPTFYRDDFRRSSKPLMAYPSRIPVHLDEKKVVLLDDVLFTGRTIRSGLQALMEYGRPSSVELMVLINRKFTRELPIEPNYVGMSIDSYDNQKVKVLWSEHPDEVSKVILTQEK